METAVVSRSAFRVYVILGALQVFAYSLSVFSGFLRSYLMYIAHGTGVPHYQCYFGYEIHLSYSYS